MCFFSGGTSHSLKNSFSKNDWPTDSDLCKDETITNNFQKIMICVTQEWSQLSVCKSNNFCLNLPDLAWIRTHNLSH